LDHIKEVILRVHSEKVNNLKLTILKSKQFPCHTGNFIFIKSLQKDILLMLQKSKGSAEETAMRMERHKRGRQSAGNY
jgi:hypothetical protein